MAATVLESPVRVRVFSQGATVLVGIVLFFHGVEGLLDLIAPTDAPSRFLFGLTLFAGSLFLLVVKKLSGSAREIPQICLGGSLTLILFANVLVFSPIAIKQIYTFRREQKRC